MDKYMDGKIYKITNKEGQTYYGSTCNTLAYRMGCHVSEHKKCGGCGKSACQIMRSEDPVIELVTPFPCGSKRELLDRERWYIRNNPCVNVEQPGRTQKEYYADNKEHINARRKAYEAANPEKVAQWRANQKARRAIDGKKKIWGRGHYERHKPQILAKQKAYRDRNIEKIRAQDRAKAAVKVPCECGEQVSAKYMKRHVLTKVHTDKIAGIVRQPLPERITCECGANVLRKVIARHKRSAKHIAAVDGQ